MRLLGLASPMSLSRPSTRSHLPTHSGDFNTEAKKWQQESFLSSKRASLGRNGCLHDHEDMSEEEGKGKGTKTRGWPTGVRRKKTTNFTCNKLAILIFCSCLIYLWARRFSEKSSVPKPILTVVDDSKPSTPEARVRPPSGRKFHHNYRTDGVSDDPL